MAGTLKDRAYEYILRGVESGAFGGGTCLSEVALARELGTSRAPVREAIAELANEGIIEQLVGSGTYVRIPTRKELEDLYELREWLECAAVAKVVEHLNDRALSAMGACHDRVAALLGEITSARTPAAVGAMNLRFAVLDGEFHAALLQATGNEEVTKVLTRLRLLTRVFNPWKTDLSETLPYRVAQTQREHERILETLRRWDADSAVRELQSHIQGAKRKALARYDWEMQKMSNRAMPTRGAPALKRRHRPASSQPGTARPKRGG
jgi:DNA-binding GntR family transcriptional regulator